MPERDSYDYAVVRVMPSIERGEFLNAGIVLFARTRGFLAARTQLDEARLRVLAPDADIETIRAHLSAIELVAAGAPGSGPIGRLSASERFHWLVAPRSTTIQVSAVHPGLCDDPQHELERLFDRLVVAAPSPRTPDPTSADHDEDPGTQTRRSRDER